MMTSSTCGPSDSSTPENVLSETEQANDTGRESQDRQTVTISRTGDNDGPTDTSGPARASIGLEPLPSGSSGQGVCGSSTSSSSVCRICQLNTAESENTLETSRCSCKGSLSRVHRQCLERWVQYRGSNQCEICGSRFVDIPNPVIIHGTSSIETLLASPSPHDAFYFQTLETIRLQLMQVQPVGRRKRTAIAAFLVFLFLVTGVTAVLTVGADQDFHRANNDPWTSETDVRKSHVVFSVCLSFLFFCITLTTGLAIMWLTVETYFYARRRRIYREAAERLVHNATSQ